MICSIIIRTYNEEQHIGRLIDGLLHQELFESLSLEIIVVDSGSTDSTVSIARHMGAEVLSISKENFSFGRALNIGCHYAKGDILLIASAHVYPVYVDWIKEMIQPFINDEKIGLVYGKQIGNKITHFSEHQVFLKWFPSVSNFNQHTPFCNNANCAIRKKIWTDQHYDEDLTGLEDLDWAQKMLSKTYKLAYNADAVIVHVHQETAEKIKNRYRREAIALKQIMPKLHLSFWGFIIFFLSNAFSDCYQASKSGVLIREFLNIFIFRYMQFYGTYLGHRHKGNISRELKNRFYYPNVLGQPQSTENDIDLRKKIKYNS